MKQKQIAVTYETVKNGYYQTGIMYLTQKQFKKLLQEKEKQK